MKILRSVIELTIKILSKIKKNKKYDNFINKNNMKKINLGSGLAVTANWLNIDGSLNSLISRWPKFIQKILYHFSGANQYYSKNEYLNILNNNYFINYDLSYGIPFSDNNIDYVYSSHFLEHLFKNDAYKLLLEAYRVLKKDGIIRICVPDLAYAVSLYQKGEKEKMLNNYFFVQDKGSFYSSHKYMYDFKMLKDILIKIGFKKIKLCSFKKGEMPEIEILDNRPDDTLFIEAVK